MAKLERTYNIPLRREWLKVPQYKRSKKAITAVRSFLQKHMKSENVKLGRQLNLSIWERGIKRPPHHVKVTAVKDDEGLVRAELFGHKIEEPKKEEKKGTLEGLKEKITGTKETKKAIKKEEPKKEVKKEEKPATKEKIKIEQKTTSGLEAVAESQAKKPKIAVQEAENKSPLAKEEKDEPKRAAVDKQT